MLIQSIAASYKGIAQMGKQKHLDNILQNTPKQNFCSAPRWEPAEKIRSRDIICCISSQYCSTQQWKLSYGAALEHSESKPLCSLEQGFRQGIVNFASKKKTNK